MATYQLDWRHLMVKIHRTFIDQPKLVLELIDYPYSGQGEKMLATAKLPAYCVTIGIRAKG